MDELVALERAGWESLCDGTAGDFYGRTMAEDGVMVLANGDVMSRPDVVAALADAPPWTSYAIDGLRVVPLNDDAIALVYVGTGRRDGAGSTFVAAMSSVYVRRGAEWRLVLYQQTPDPDAAEGRRFADCISGRQRLGQIGDLFTPRRALGTARARR